VKVKKKKNEKNAGFAESLKCSNLDDGDGC
jgi:hypothetical protein